MKSVFLVLAAVIISSRLPAQDTTSAKQLDELIVTATKFQQKQSTTGKVVSIIDQQTLDRSAGKSLSEIINYQAGIFISGANNNLGTNQDIYFRGAGTGNTLILIDGVPVGDPSQINNSFDVNNIAVGQIERIEILKGAQSTLWGSDAVAGVINIITKKGGVKKISPAASIAYGSYHTFKATAGASGKSGAFTYNLHYNHITSRGFSSAYDSTGNKNFDKDDFTQNNMLANLGYQFTPKFAASIMSNYGRYKTGIDAGAFNDDKDYILENTSAVNTLQLKYKSNKSIFHFTNTLMYAKRRLLNDSTNVIGNKDYFSGHYKGNSFISELMANFSLVKKLSLVSGIQLLAQRTDQKLNGYADDFAYAYSSALGDSAKANNFSVYNSILLTELNGFNVEAGFRFNNHNIYGNNTTYTFNPSYNIDENTKLFVNISSAYKIPSLYQLYSEYGNKVLKPEKSNNYEMGVQTFSNNKRNSFRIVGFKRDIKNLVIFYTDPVSFASQYLNRDEQHDYGFELESTIAIGKKGNWTNNFTYVDGEGINNSVKTKNFFRRPNFMMNSILHLQPAKRFTLMPSFRFIGTRLKGQYDAGPAQMPQYYHFDCYLGYEFSTTFRLYVDFRNITNQQYFDVAGYISRRFNAMTGISFFL